MTPTDDYGVQTARRRNEPRTRCAQTAAQVAEARLRRVLIFTAVAAAVAVASLGVAFLAVMAR